MWTFLRRLLLVALLLVVLAAGGAIAAFYLTPSSWIAQRAADAVRKQTGRELVIEGEIERGLFPSVYVKMGSVSLSNADWAGDEPMFAMQSATVRLSTLPLVTGALEIEELVIDQPVIRLARTKTGEANWSFPGSEGSDRGRGSRGGGGDGAGDLIIADARIANGALYFDDQTADARYEITDVNFTASLPAKDAPLNLDGSASIDGRPATLSAVVETLDALAEGEPASAKFQLETAGVSLSFDGEAAAGAEDDAPLGKGSFQLAFDGEADETAWLRALLPPKYADVGQVAAKGDFSASKEAFDATIDGDVAFRGRNVTLDVTAKAADGWLDGAAPIALDVASGSADFFDLAWTGSVAMKSGGEELQKIDGDLAFSSPELRGLLDWAGVGPIEAPQGTFQSASVKTSLAIDDASASLGELEITLDDTQVAGDVRLDLPGGERPKLTASLTSGPLDLRPFTPSSSGGSGAAAGSGGGDWSAEPFDFGVFRLIDVDMKIETAGLTTNVVRFTDAAMTAKLDDGELALEVEKMTLYGGAATAKVTLGTGGTPDLAVVADIGGVALRPLLNDAAKMDWLEGTGEIKLDIATSGASMKAMMKALAGSASVDFQDGAIIGYNLAALARNITSLGSANDETQKTDFASLTASFDIKDGVARNDDFRMQGPLLRASGSGSIDIGERTIDYRVEPKAVATLEGQGGAEDLSGLVFPVNIRGSWDDPSVEPDLAAALTNIDGILANPDQLGDAFTKALGGGEGGGGLGDAIGDAIRGGDGAGGGLIDGLLGGGSQPATDPAAEGADAEGSATDEEKPTGGSIGGVPLPGGLFDN